MSSLPITVPGNTAVIVNVINSTTVSLVLNHTMAKICGVEVRNQAGTLMLSRNASTSSEYVYVLTLDQTVPVGTTSLNFTVTPCCGGNINAWWAYPLIPQSEYSFIIHLSVYHTVTNFL